MMKPDLFITATDITTQAPDAGSVAIQSQKTTAQTFALSETNNDSVCHVYRVEGNPCGRDLLSVDWVVDQVLVPWRALVVAGKWLASALSALD